MSSRSPGLPADGWVGMVRAAGTEGRGAPTGTVRGGAGAVVVVAAVVGSGARSGSALVWAVVRRAP